MCCVMPPASPETTLVSRIASSRLVLPWSTWPRIVTTGRARDEILGGVVEDLGGLDLVGRARDRDLALELGADHLDGLVRERLRDADELAEAHHDLLDLGGRDAERGGEVLDGDAGADGRGTRREPEPLRGAPCGARRGRGGRAGAVSRCGREAAVSITTRRRPPSCGPRCGPRDARAAGRVGAGAVAAAGGRAPAAGCGALAPAGRAAPPAAAAAGRGPPAGGAGAARGSGRLPARRPARGARRGWNGRRRGRALRRPRRRCLPAGARRPRRGGGPPLRDRARARGRYRLHAF